VSVAAGRESRDRARAVRRFLRSRGAGRFAPTAYQIYATVVTGAIFGALAGHAISDAIGGSLDAHKLLVYGPVLLMLVLLAAVRFGAWQGPVLFSAPDVGLLMAAPIALAALIKPKLDQSLMLGAVAGAVVGGIGLLLMAGGPANVGGPRSAAWVVAFACFSLLATAESWLVECTRTATGLVRRASPAALAFGAALLLAASSSSVGRTVGVWSGPWGWVIAPLAGTRGWPVALILLAGTTIGAVVIARRRSGSPSAEQLLTRAETRAGLTASAYSLDYRGAALTYRSALPGTGAVRLPRVRRPSRSGLVVLWRDSLALLRDRARVGWAVLLGAAGTYEILLHPGRVVPAGVGAAALYFAASLLCEPLRVDVDQPDRSELLLSWPFARVLVAHCVLPTLAMFAIGTVTIAGAVVAGGVGVGALALIPTLLGPVVAIAVLCTALAARRGGRIDDTLMSAFMSSDPSNPVGIVTVVLFLAPWLLLDIAAIASCALIVGHAAAHTHRTVSAAVLALILSCAVAATLLRTARRSRRP
jgi:hypothetical protein